MQRAFQMHYKKINRENKEIFSFSFSFFLGFEIRELFLLVTKDTRYIMRNGRSGVKDEGVTYLF